MQGIKSVENMQELINPVGIYVFDMGVVYTKTFIKLNIAQTDLRYEERGRFWKRETQVGCGELLFITLFSFPFLITNVTQFNFGQNLSKSRGGDRVTTYLYPKPPHQNFVCMSYYKYV
eukprot:TRINITY_DN198_c0_g1_i8.p8 TRINITY_DN198_c0_g1~~TRINITY_DN198_c0_g1_i8.p8  ORF type:complete len:118 (-),score=2.14 TRINITY_DN198_c0_g1_i8:1234-1587(-)